MITKICSKCKQTFNIDQFSFVNRKKGTRHCQCNVCKRNTAKQSYARHKKRVIEKSRQRTDIHNQWFREFKKKLICCICGEKDWVCLDFHHINPKEKLFGLNISRRYRSRKDLINEINKCACVCSNCHRKVHAGIITAPLVKLNITQCFEH